MQEQNPIVLMNFSGIYREEEFWKNRQVSWIELQDVCGTNCYCDEEAIAEINKRTENYPTAGIHFIDSGNYHYMTRLWLTRMDQPFRLCNCLRRNVSAAETDVDTDCNLFCRL